MPTKTFGRRGLVPAVAVASAPRFSVATPAVAQLPHAQDAEEMDGGDLFVAHLPILTCGLIAFLMVIYGIEQKLAFDIGADGSLSGLSLRAFGASGFDLVFGGEIWRPFLAPLLHASFSHFLGNSFALFFVGMRLERLIGRAWFAAIFAVSAAGGILGSMFGNPHFIVTVGASGAITGLIGALFVVSFNHRAQNHDERAMRMTALKFGVPALAPLAFGATGHTDYFAHLGGAIAGALVAWSICAIWSEDRFRPNFTGFAAAISMTCLTGSLIGCAFAAHGYAGYRAQAAQLIPTAERPKGLKADGQRSMVLLTRYPKDPLAHVIRAVYLADHDGLGAAEQELRHAMTLAGTDPQNQGLRDLSRSILALVLAQGRRFDEARTIASDLCRRGGEPRKILSKAGLCLESPTAATRPPAHT